MNYTHYAAVIAAVVAGMAMSSCNDDMEKGNDSSTVAVNDGTLPSFSQSIVQWNGEKADDKDMDSVESDDGIYHEANTFRHTVQVTFSDDGAIVQSSNPRIKTYTDGAYVTVDFQTGDISGVKIVLTGATTDGGLKIYGASKFRLDLNDVSIVSRRGPAINSQCKKRIFVNLAEGSSNLLVDAAEYSDDPYYMPDNDPALEDRKGAFFAEGNLIFSGAGTLEVKGKYRHGIATDGYVVVRPGVTIAVTEAKNNCVQAKGSTSEALGMRMKGGLLYCLASSPAGKAVKSDQSVIIDGGKLILNTAGDAIYDSEEVDTSSPACIKTDTRVQINGGNLALRSVGLGGKGINADSIITINSGIVGVSTSGEQFVTGAYTASSKGITATKGIIINDGNVTVMATGASDGSKAIESDGYVTVNGGIIDAYAYDDAVNASQFSASDCILTAYSVDGDGIRGKESLTISSGTIVASAGAESSGLSCNTSEAFRISGGSVFALGGKLKSSPAASDLWKVFTNINIAKGQSFNLIGASNNVVTSFKAPRTYTDATVLVADAAISATTVTSTTVAND